MEPLNRMALELVDEAIDFADELAIDTVELDNEATVLDFGVDTYGGIEAGLLLAELQTAGLATVQARVDDLAGTTRTYVELATDHPALALLCSGKAGWEVSVDGYEALGSGPARALVAGEDVYDRVGYEESFDFAVLTLEADELPDEAVASHVADLTDVNESAVFLPTFRTGSLAGSVTMAARAAELVTFRLAELGYDPLDIISATASAPMAPVAGTEEEAIARTNDAIVYGGEVHLTVDEEFDRFEEAVSTAATEYGEPSIDVFEGVDWEFGELSTDLFAPAKLTVDVLGGPTKSFGETDEALLAESFGL